MTEIKFEWIKTSKKMPPSHQIIIFVDKYDNFHYGVFCSELSEPNKRNKYWCHIFQKILHKKDVSLWALVPEMDAFRILYPSQFKENEYTKLDNFIWRKIQQIENEILEDAKKCDYEKSPGVIVRNALHRFSCDILKMNRSGRREP